MEWPRRCCRFTILVLLAIFLASSRDASASAARRTGVVVGDVPARSDSGSTSRRAGISMEMPSISCKNVKNTDTKRKDDGGVVRRNSKPLPRGYEEFITLPEISDKELIIAVPQKGGFEDFLKFAIDIFETAMKELQQPHKYKLCSFDGTYDELVRNVSENVFDGAAGDVTITAERAGLAAFTMPYAPSGEIKSPLTKIVVVTWCFLVLVVVQSYTANLSSMLTAKTLPHSVIGLDQLVQDNDSKIGYQKGAFLHSFLINKGVHRDRLRAYDGPTEYAEALRNGSKNGGVSAILDEIPYISYFLHGHNKEFEMGQCLYKTPGFAFVFPRNSTLVHNLSVAILNLTERNRISLVEQKWFGSGGTLTGESNPIADSAPLTLGRFSGLFLITGCVSASMLFIAFVMWIYAQCSTRARQRADGNGGDVRLGEHSALPEGAGNGSMPDQHIHDEIRDTNDTQGAHGGRTDEQAAGLIQDSDLQHDTGNGSVPEISGQIEMASSGQATGMAL